MQRVVLSSKFTIQQGCLVDIFLILMLEILLGSFQFICVNRYFNVRFISLTYVYQGMVLELGREEPWLVSFMKTIYSDENVHYG